MVPARCIKLCRTAQRALTLQFAEHVMKACTYDQAMVIGNLINEKLEMDIDLSEIEVNDENILSNGWHGQPCVDPHILALVCAVLEYSTYNAEHKSMVMPHSMRLACAHAVKHESIVSVRMKSLFKTVNGATRQLGKVGWELIKSVAAEHVAVLEVSSPTQVSELNDTLEVLKEGWVGFGEDWLALAEDLSQFLEISGSKLSALSDAFGKRWTPKSEEEEAIARLLASVPRTLITHLSKLLGIAPLQRLTANIFDRSMITNPWYQEFKQSVLDSGESMQQDYR